MTDSLVQKSCRAEGLCDFPVQCSQPHKGTHLYKIICLNMPSTLSLCKASYDDTGNEKAKEVLVKMTNLKTNQVWVWSKAKFINRKYLIEELYNQMICEGRERDG